jgi:phosphate transport system substrate-binding protein
MRVCHTLLAAGAMVALLGCGGEPTVHLNGAGATFPNLIYQKWIIDYNAATEGVELNYQSIGSGGGIRQFTDGTVDFGGSDAPMTEEEMAAVNGNVLHIPTVLGAVVPTYNVMGVDHAIRFTPDALAGIFLGEITRWNDARIASVNPGVALPNAEIVVAHRSDGSGTTFIWTDYLSKVSEPWKSTVGTGKSVNWPVGLGARGNEGVTATVQQTPGAIGYVELGYALLNGLPVGQVQNRAGNFIEPSIASVTAAASGAMGDMGPDTDFRVSLTNSAGADAYPVASFTWILLRKQYDNAADATALLNFVWWALTKGEAAAPELGYAPIPDRLTPWIADRLRSITASGTAVWNGPAGT